MEGLIDLDKPFMRKCSFCDKGRKEVACLIIGPRVSICNECVDQCSDILDLEYPPAEATDAE